MSDDARAEEIKALCRDLGEEMVSILRDIAGDPSAKEAPRVKAAETILHMGFGSPAKKVEKTVDVTLHDHRAASLQAFRKLALEKERTQLLIPDYTEADFEEVEKRK